MLICNQQTLISKSPTDNKEQRKFLGYEWSNRKGSEGIKYLNLPNSNDEDEDEITETSKALQSINTALYDPNENPNDEQTLNSNKLNFWIRQNFIQAMQKNTSNLSGSLKDNEASKYAQMVYLRDCIDFKKGDFDLAINLSAQSKIEIVLDETLSNKYKFIKISNLLEKLDNINKKVEKDNILENGKYPVISQNTTSFIDGYSNNEPIKLLKPIILFGDHTCCFKYIDFDFLRGADGTQILNFNDEVNTKFAYFLMQNLKIPNSDKYERHFKYLKDLKIPLPPLAIQQQIVAECESVDNKIANLNSEINGFKQKSTEIFDEFNIKFDENLSLSGKTKTIHKFVKIDEIANLIRGVTYDKSNVSLNITKNAVLTADNIDLEGNFVLNKIIYIDESINFDNIKRLLQNDIFICLSSGSKTHIGKVAFINENTDYFIGGFMGILRTKENVIPKYVYMVLNNETIREIVRNLSTGSNINNLNSKILDLKIPLPPLEVQEKIVTEFEKIENKIAARKEKLKNLNGAYNKILDKYLK